MLSPSPIMIQDARPEIDDTPLTLLLGWGNEHGACHFPFKAGQYLLFRLM
jgi:hypothetical protein